MAERGPRILPGEYWEVFCRCKAEYLDVAQSGVGGAMLLGVTYRLALAALARREYMRGTCSLDPFEDTPFEQLTYKGQHLLQVNACANVIRPATATPEQMFTMLGTGALVLAVDKTQRAAA